MLELVGLEISTPTATLVEGVSFVARSGRTLVVIGESGSGKTVSALALVGALPVGLSARWSSLLVDGIPVVERAQLDALRGRVIGLMPQNASSALDPIMRVGDQVEEIVTHVARHAGGRARARSLLAEVGLGPEVDSLLPHQLSGGMQQRALLALTLAAEPKVLVLDEPTSALDVSLRRGALELFRRIVRERHVALIVITHDLETARALADDVVVLSAGRVVESGEANVLSSPRHPHTRALVARE